MHPSRSRFLLPIAALLFAVAGLCSAQADDADAVKEKLFQAKKTYDTETQKFRQAVAEVLDKREADARKTGNKKGVDQAKAERKAFEETGELPMTVPLAVLKSMVTARANLDRAYAAAVKEYVKLKEDSAAEAAEKEQAKFAIDAAFLFGRRTFLSTLKPSDVKTSTKGFDGDTGRFKMNGELVTHSIFLHPTTNSHSSVSYNLAGKAVAFRTSVGIPKHADIAGAPASPLTFEVLGDGKSLWKSQPVSKLDTFQTCAVNVEKVKTLTLRVHCPGDQARAHGIWFGPILVE